MSNYMNSCVWIRIKMSNYMNSYVWICIKISEKEKKRKLGFQPGTNMACNRRSGTPPTTPPSPSVPILFIYRTIRRPSKKVDYTISPVWHIVNPLNGCDVVIEILVLRLFFSTRKAGDEPRRVVPAVRGRTMAGFHHHRRVFRSLYLL